MEIIEVLIPAPRIRLFALLPLIGLATDGLKAIEEGRVKVNNEVVLDGWIMLRDGDLVECDGRGVVFRGEKL